jgi:hypothetical protein
LIKLAITIKPANGERNEKPWERVVGQEGMMKIRRKSRGDGSRRLDMLFVGQ